MTLDFFEKDYFSFNISKNDADRAFKSISNAKDVLLNGFTSVRDLGSINFTNNSLRDAINSKLIIGPKIMSAGNFIGTTGGHADPTNGLNKK